MHAKWLVSIGSSCMGTLVSYQALLGTKVSESTMFLRLVLYAAKAVLLTAVGRPHPKVTNWFFSFADTRRPRRVFVCLTSSYRFAARTSRPRG